MYKWKCREREREREEAAGFQDLLVIAFVGMWKPLPPRRDKWMRGEDVNNNWRWFSLDFFDIDVF